MTLRLRNLSARYRKDAWTLGPVSLAADTNRLLGIIGPNGSGKSTLFRVLVGELSPRQGRALMGDTDLLALSCRERARRLAYLEQNPGVAFDYRVREVVELANFARRPGDADRVEWALDQVGMNFAADRSVHELSGGQRRRVYLARALAQQPRLLLLDEPSTGLDLTFTWKLPEILRTARRRFGELTVLWALHDLEQASRVCDRLVLLEDGRVHSGPAPAPDVLTARSLRAVYGVRADVRPDPATGGVRITPANRRNRVKLQSLSR